ncbi:2-phospho-L-lactate transferase [Sphingobium sp. MK2]|uniref:2-phospho-L-lactate transferase n=1 Tax=Sphingobium sp. MK2 TaxID=3116540 RepID=UPI0032E36476
MSIVALAGGVGGARMALALASVLPPRTLSVIVNTGDDFTHLGLAISPDIDSVLYTMAGINDAVRGWGQADESWAFMDALRRLGGEDWFALGDRDLATHVLRTRALESQPLSAITCTMAARLGIQQAVLPMSDDPVPSMVLTDQGELAFQDYFVRFQSEPRFCSIRFSGVENARPAPGVIDAIDAAEGIVICPSNPWLSIAPIRAVPGIEDSLNMARRRGTPIVAVSPFIGGEAVKGPAAKILRELGKEPTPTAIADVYAGLVTDLVIDHQDADLPRPEGMAVHVTHTLMRDEAVRIALGQAVLAIIANRGN